MKEESEFELGEEFLLEVKKGYEMVILGNPQQSHRKTDFPQDAGGTPWNLFQKEDAAGDG